MEKNIGEIISECLDNPIIQHKCTISNRISASDNDRAKKAFARMLGYCILFKSNEGIEDYMRISNTNLQIRFLQEKIASKLGIDFKDIENKMNQIVNYAYENFVENGYVFHSANSLSIEEKMKNGLKGNSVNYEQQKELLKIDSIFKKYGTDKPLAWGIIDIEQGNTGWFYDGNPEGIQYYSNSPEWFNQFCGEAGLYNGLIPFERRHGYENRDYDTAKEAVTALINKNQMSEEDEKEVWDFFNKWWKVFGKSEPGVILVPFSKTRSQEILQRKKESSLPYYYEKPQYFFEEIISCDVTGRNQMSNDDVSAQDLACVNLSRIFLQTKIKRNEEIEITLQECLRKLKGFNLEDLKVAQQFLDSIVEKNKEQEEK